VLERNNLFSSQKKNIEVPRGEERKCAVEMVDQILGNALLKHGAKFEGLPASVQYSITDDVVMLKTKLVDKIVDVMKRTGRLDVTSCNEIIESMTEGIKSFNQNR